MIVKMGLLFIINLIKSLLYCLLIFILKLGGKSAILIFPRPHLDLGRNEGRERKLFEILREIIS